MPAQKSSAQKHGQRKLAHIAGLTAHRNQLEPKKPNRRTSTELNPVKKNLSPDSSRSGESSPSNNTSGSDSDLSPFQENSDSSSQLSMGSGGNIKLRRLAWSVPPFFFQVSPANYPPNVIQILRRLEKASRDYSFLLDPELQTVIKAAYPQYDFSSCHSALPSRRLAAEISSDLLNHVKDLHEQATSQTSTHDNGENVWYTIVKMALSYDQEAGEIKTKHKEKEQINDR